MRASLFLLLPHEAALLKPLDHSEKSDQFNRIEMVVASLAFKEAVFSDHVNVEICPAHNDTGIAA